MSFWTAVVVICAIAAVTWLRAQKYRAMGHGNPSQTLHDAHTPREHELEREIQAMRERLIVLERIATDEKRGKDLAEEIESLRDR